MWIFLSNSFLSIVDKGDPSGATLLVRARIDRKVVAKTIAAELQSVRYANFKSTVKDRRRHDAYLEVWDAMMDYQSDLRRLKDSNAK